MTKRRTEEILFGEVPFKRCFSLSSTNDTALAGMHAATGFTPPSLIAVLGSHCRKRSHDLEEHDFVRPRKQRFTKSGRQLCAQDGIIEKNVKSLPEPDNFFPAIIPTTTLKKQERNHLCQLRNAPNLVKTPLSDDDDELNPFNSFQFWRAPLPDLDLSVLQNDNPSQPVGGLPAGEFTFDLMET